MKKIFMFFAAIALMFAAVACNPSQKEDAQIKFVYDIAAIGDANGEINFAFPDGIFKTNGEASLELLVSNDTSEYEPVYLLANALDSANDIKVYESALNVNNWMNEEFALEAVSGTYYIHLTGIVRETLTGLVFAIDKEFTNIDTLKVVE